MISPTSKFPPVNAKLCHRDWSLTCWLLKEKTKELRKLKRGYVDESLWLMSQIGHLRALKDNNIDFIFGELLNP